MAMIELILGQYIAGSVFARYKSAAKFHFARAFPAASASRDMIYAHQQPLSPNENFDRQRG